MEQIAIDIKSIENSIAKYIFKKYIISTSDNQSDTQPDAQPDTQLNVQNDNQHNNQSDNQPDNLKDNDIDIDINIDDNTSSKDDNEQNISEVESILEDDVNNIANDNANNSDNDNNNSNDNNSFNNKLYRIYMQKIFDLERTKFRIFQEDVLKEDLKHMAIADKEYEHNPKEYKISQNIGHLPDVLRCTFIRKYKHRYYRCKNKVINDDSDVCKIHETYENIYIDKYNELLP